MQSSDSEDGIFCHSTAPIVAPGWVLGRAGSAEVDEVISRSAPHSKHRGTDQKEV